MLFSFLYFFIDFTFGFRLDSLDLFYHGNLFGQATFKGDFIVLDLDDNYNNISSAFVSYFDSNSESVKWHTRLGHVGQARINRLAEESLLDRLTRVKLPKCESYLAGKSTMKAFGKAPRASGPLELFHSNICRPMNIKARHGAIYFITLTDDYSRYGHVYICVHTISSLRGTRCVQTLRSRSRDLIRT